MTNESIDDFIRSMSDKSFDKPYSKYEISPNVELARVWFNPPRGETSNESHSRMYLIKNGPTYVGAVFEMGENDLHWYVLEEYRKMGYLHKSLHEDILPHIFLDERDAQRATADSKENEAYLIRQGFEQCPDDLESYYLKKQKVKLFDIRKINRHSLSNDEVEILSTQLRKTAGDLRVICDKLESAYGYDLNLSNCVRSMKSQASEIAWMKVKKDIG